MQRSSKWFHRHGSLERAPWSAVVDSSMPGWAHTGIRVASIETGDAIELGAGELERVIVPLAGSFDVNWSRAESVGSIRLAGRASVFEGPTDVAYLGRDTSAVITGSGRFAVAEAPAAEHHPSVHIETSVVPVELRGAGRSSRQVHNFATPAVLEASSLIVCEVITPAGNWSSYPPHKHDELVPGREARLEEIYYFESAVERGTEGHPDAVPFGLHRTYSSAAGEIDVTEEVRSGDIALVPYGWHGPCVAAPGYDLYYLNVMAGPDPEREWRITDDPAHAWVRDSWTDEPIDARLPYLPSTEGQSQ